MGNPSTTGSATEGTGPSVTAALDRRPFLRLTGLARPGFAGEWTLSACGADTGDAGGAKCDGPVRLGV